ncbi:hypothetical protein ACFV2Z_39985 [Streptomyces sp. NPDC059688]|uniref:hypothetical protein n=1 Tax=Streptomyces sp. NPDC059688 TaxID=3346906 RepID=UPI00367A048C
MASLKAAGYSVAAANQDGEPVSGVYNAAKQGVRLVVEARQSWSTGSILAVDVRSGHPVLPSAPASAGVEARVPVIQQLTFMASGRNDVPQALYALSPTSSVNDCIASFKQAGFKVKAATQDNETITNVYRATNTKTSFTIERVPTFSLGDIITVTP